MCILIDSLKLFQIIIENFARVHFFNTQFKFIEETSEGGGPLWIRFSLEFLLTGNFSDKGNIPYACTYPRLVKGTINHRHILTSRV